MTKLALIFQENIQTGSSGRAPLVFWADAPHLELNQTPCEIRTD